MFFFVFCPSLKEVEMFWKYLILWSKSKSLFSSPELFSLLFACCRISKVLLSTTLTPARTSIVDCRIRFNSDNILHRASRAFAVDRNLCYAPCVQNWTKMLKELNLTFKISISVFVQRYIWNKLLRQCTWDWSEISHRTTVYMISRVVNKGLVLSCSWFSTMRKFYTRLKYLFSQFDWSGFYGAQSGKNSCKQSYETHRGPVWVHLGSRVNGL